MSRRFGNGIDLALQRIINLATPSAGTDAATKQYVDDRVNGLSWKDEVRVATTTAGTLATSFAAGQTVDGVTLAIGDRILIKDQATQSENGIYIVTAGTPTRATDADTTGELNNATVKVTSGTTNGANGGATFTQTTANPTVGTSNIVFVASIGGTTYTSGNGALAIVGSVISAIVKAGGGLLIGADGLAIDPTSQYARRAPYAANVPAGQTTTVITHNLNTTDVKAVVYDITTANSYVEIDTDVIVTGVNTLSLVFATAPTTGQYRVVVFS